MVLWRVPGSCLSRRYLLLEPPTAPFKLGLTGSGSRYGWEKAVIHGSLVKMEVEKIPGTVGAAPTKRVSVKPPMKAFVLAR
jgi:hypothetical protein